MTSQVLRLSSNVERFMPTTVRCISLASFIVLYLGSIVNRYPTLTQEFSTVIEPGPKIWLVDGETIAAQTCRPSRSPSPDPIPYDPCLPLMSTSNQSVSSTVEATYHLIPLDQFCNAILGASPELAQTPSYAEGNGSDDTFVVPKKYLEAFHEYNASFEPAKDGSNREQLLAQLLNSALDELPSPSLQCYARSTKDLQQPNDLPSTVMGFSYRDMDSCLPNGSSVLDSVVVAMDFQPTLIVDDDDDDDDEWDIKSPPRDFAAEHSLPRHVSRLQSYALKVSSSGTRRHLLGILVQASWLSFYVFDPSGGVYTPCINLLSDSKKVIDILKRIASCDIMRLGLDPTFVSDDMRSHTSLTTLAGHTTTIGGQRVTLTKQLYVESRMSGWGMTIFEATCQLDPTSDVGGRQRINFRCCPLPDKALVKIYWRTASFDDPYQPVGSSVSSLGTSNLSVSELRGRLSRGFRKEMGLGYYEDYYDMEQWVELMAPSTALVNFENFKASFLDNQKYASVCDS